MGCPPPVAGHGVAGVHQQPRRRLVAVAGGAAEPADAAGEGMGHEEFAAARAEGRAMGLDPGIDAALHGS